jgi:ABC-type multidrug transport system permease subunit
VRLKRDLGQLVNYIFLQAFLDPPSFVECRFFKQYLLLLAVNQMAASLFRFVGGAARNMIVANVFGSFMLLIFMVLGGYILVRGTTLHFFRKKKKNFTLFST